MQTQDKYISPSLKHTARYQGLFEIEEGNTKTINTT